MQVFPHLNPRTCPASNRLMVNRDGGFFNSITHNKLAATPTGEKGLGTMRVTLRYPMVRPSAPQQ